jgi:hypothetical protein
VTRWLRAVPLAALLAAAAAAGACSHQRRPSVTTAEPAPPVPIVAPPWPATLDSVRTAIDERRYGDAERILAAFSATHSGSPDVAESEFWRALVLADPANTSATPSAALGALDTYLARGPESPHYVKALVIRRLITTGDSLRTAAVAAARAAADARDRARDDEMQKLRDSLAATTAELDRIKRRLTGRKP